MGKLVHIVKGSRYLRKHRKWPNETRWHKQQQQEEALQNRTSSSSNSQTCNKITEFVFLNLIKAYGQLPIFPQLRSVHSLNALLSVLCSSKQAIGFVPHVLVMSQQMGIRVEESSFRILIAALCRIKMVDYALQIFRFLMNDGCDLDLKVCSLILAELCEERAASVDGVLRFFYEVRELGFCPRRVDYANLIRLLVKSGRGADALDMLERMKGDGLKPHIFCYTMVLEGMVEAEKFDKAENLLDELLLLGLVPDVCTYCVYIKGLCKQNKFEDGFKMLEYMDRLGCKPNPMTYNILLDGLCKVGELERAKNVFTEMGLKGVGSNLLTYKIILDGLIGRGQIIESCNLSLEMLDKYTNFQCTQIDEIICQLCERDMISTALELLDKMANKNVAPGRRSWGSLLLSSVTNLSMAEVTMARLLESE